MGKLDVKQCKVIIDFMSDYIEYYRELLDFEKKKLILVTEDDIDGLIASISTEQALVMQSESLENKRLKLFNSLGLADMTYKNIAENSPDEFKTKIEEDAKEFSALVLEIQKINKGIETIINEKFKSMGQDSDKEITAYTDKGKKISNSGNSSVIKDI